MVKRLSARRGSAHKNVRIDFQTFWRIGTARKYLTEDSITPISDVAATAMRHYLRNLEYNRRIQDGRRQEYEDCGYEVSF